MDAAKVSGGRAMNLDDLQRLDELRRYQLFDDGPDAAFGVLAELAASVCEAPIGYISFIDERHPRLLVVDAAGTVTAHNAATTALFDLPYGSSITLASVAERLRDPEPLLARSRSLSPDESVEIIVLRDGRVAGRVWSFRPAPTA